MHSYRDSVGRALGELRRLLEWERSGELNVERAGLDSWFSRLIEARLISTTNLLTCRPSRASGWGMTPFGKVTRPPSRTDCRARSAASPPAVISAASIPFGANCRAASTTSSFRPFTTVSAKKFFASATPSSLTRSQKCVRQHACKRAQPDAIRHSHLRS